MNTTTLAGLLGVFVSIISIIIAMSQLYLTRKESIKVQKTDSLENPGLSKEILAIENSLQETTERLLKIGGPGEGRSKLLHEMLRQQQEQIQEILTLIKKNPEIEYSIREHYVSEFRVSRRRQFIVAFVGNVVSIISGWLLSGLLNPANVIPFFHR